MSDQRDHKTDTTAEDQAFLDGARQLHRVLEHPFAVGFLAVAGVLVLFWLGIRVGETLFGAFDGNAGGVAVFGFIFATAIGAVITTGAWLDRRRHAHDDEPFLDEQG